MPISIVIDSFSTALYVLNDMPISIVIDSFSTALYVLNGMPISVVRQFLYCTLCFE
jgi:uncharacterized membrane protein YczE